MDPTLRTRTLAALKTGARTFTPQMRLAAKYVIDHPSDFGLDSIRETAKKARVSTYTLVNMSKTLDFPSYEAFRMPFRQALLAAGAVQSDPDWLSAMRAQGDNGRVFADAAKNALSIVSYSLERQSLADLTAVADLLHDARRTYLTAVRSSFAVAYYLHYVGRMALPDLALIPRHQNSPIDDLNDAGPEDALIAITVAPYSRETIEACTFARQKGMKVVLITDSEVVMPELEPDYTLVTSVLSTHSFGCFAGMMAVIDLLIALLMQRGGPDAEARIKSYEDLRQTTNAYWGQ